MRIGISYDPVSRIGVFITSVAGADGDSVRAMIGRDLDFGDRVTVIAAEAGPPPTGTLNYDLYARLTARAIVQVSVTPQGSLHVAVHDVVARQVMNVGDFAVGGAAPLSPAWRMAVHRASDEIERWITGTRGISATRIAFVRDQRLFIVDSDGAEMQSMGVGGVALSPAWHPTARYLAYATMTDDGTHIAVRDLVTGQSRRLGDLGGTNITPAFSPDGSTLVFSSGDDGTDSVCGVAVRRRCAAPGDRGTWEPDVVADLQSGRPQDRLTSRVDWVTLRCILPMPMERVRSCWDPRCPVATRRTARVPTGRPTAGTSHSRRRKVQTCR